MNDKDIKDLVQAWLTYQRNWWAFDRMLNLIYEQPNEAWIILQTLTENADTDMLLEDIGAGPLEEFIGIHANEFIDQFETYAEESSGFRKALSSVWLKDKEGETNRRLLAIGCTYNKKE